jgi:replicative DNA helicase
MQVNRDKTIEQLLYDMRSERRVLSSMLHSEDACIEAHDQLAVSDFYSPRNGTFFALICSLYERDVRLPMSNYSRKAIAWEC